LTRVWKKDELAIENPYSEIDYHRILSSINPIFFPHFMGVVVENNYAYYYMEKGKCIFDHVTDWQRGTYGNIKHPEVFERFENEAKTLFLHYLQALHFMHEHGFTHADVKLENMIFIEDENGNKRGKLIDLGSCKKHDLGTNEEEYDFEIDMIMHSGTIFNMSPERRLHFKPAEAARWRIKLENTARYNAAKDDLWSWAFGILNFLVGGYLWELKNFTARRIRDRPTQRDYSMFALGTGGSYLLNDEIREQWFGNKIEICLKELVKKRGCHIMYEFCSRECFDMLAKIFLPEHKRATVEEILEDPWFLQ